MAVVRNDVNEVTRILSLFPGSIAELDIYGQSPLHLAAAKPRILALLVEAADLSLLNQPDKAGFTVLEAATILSSAHCINDSKPDRCRRCTCSQCVEILLKAGCNVRTRKVKRVDRSVNLRTILDGASELARRRYVYHMKELRTPRPRRLSFHRCLPTTRKTNATNTNDVEDWGWIYDEITNSHLGELFYRHGFRPDPSFFIHLRHYPKLDNFKEHDYIRWLAEKGADLFLRSWTGPSVVENSPYIGLFGAHYALFYLGFTMTGPTVGPELTSLLELVEAVEHHNLTDNCQCYCSIGGCSPFIWMMKGMVSNGWRLKCLWAETPDFRNLIGRIITYYWVCGPELRTLTYRAAIRYVTFEALGIMHTCCNATSLAQEKEEWVEGDDRDIINEEQAALLELHEELVEEFENEALMFMEDGPNGGPRFIRFWLSCWIVRIKEVREELAGDAITDAERRGAEDIGVNWHETLQKCEEVDENPYGDRTVEFYFQELDLLCPEYKEPWPKDLRRVVEFP